ncbi:MAG: SOS response-associated peptidase [Granulosicoccus sp.]
MCGRINVSDHEGLRALLAMMGMQVWPITAPRFNVAPSAIIDVITLTANTPAARPVVSQHDTLALQKMRWGFAANAQSKNTRMLFNARSETVFSKPAFRASAHHRRALVPINGFYEWLAASTGRKRAFYIAQKHKPALALAAIYQIHVPSAPKPVKMDSPNQHRTASQMSLEFTDDVDLKKIQPPEDKAPSNHLAPVNDVCVLTMPANQQMSAIHERMPFVLEPAQAQRWLREGSDEMLATLRDGAARTVFDIKEVNGSVNSAANDGPECLSPANENDTTD